MAVLPKCLPSVVLGSKFEIISLYFQQLLLRTPPYPRKQTSELGGRFSAFAIGTPAAASNDRSRLSNQVIVCV